MYGSGPIFLEGALKKQEHMEEDVLNISSQEVWAIYHDVVVAAASPKSGCISRRVDGCPSFATRSGFSVF